MTNALSLYATLIRFSFRNHLGEWRYMSYRLASFIFFTLVFGEFWRALIGQRTQTFGFDGNDVVWYAAVGQLIMFASSRIFVRIEDDILSGNIAYSLTRPVDYLELRLAEGIGGLLANLTLFMPVGFLVCYFYTGVMPKGSLAFTALFILLASLMHMLFQVLAGFTGIWLHEVQLVYRIYQKIMALLGGLEVPIIIYPAWAQYLSWATPLGLMLSCAMTSVYMTDKADLDRNAGLLVGWTVVMFVLTLRSYKYVQRYICVNGG